MTPRAWRTSVGLTLKTLSEKMDVEAGYLSEIERGVKTASGKVMKLYHEHSNGLVGLSDWQALDKKAREQKQ